MDSADSLEEKDSAADVQINFPESVMSRIEELMGDTEQFDSPEFDAISYINRMFPTEQSLSGVEAAAARAEWRLAGLRRSLAAALQRAPARAPGRAALLQARGVIADLATQVEDINQRASRSESMVREITCEIKQLDCAKWNLTAAITALNHYHMLAGGAEALRTMTDNRQYKEIMLPLQAIMEVLQHFESYRDIPELSALRDRVTDIRRQLAQQTHDDVKDYFTAGSKSSMSHAAVGDACAVLELLDHAVRDRLLAWFIDTQLQEYRHLFSPEQEVSWLPHVERRYSWLKQHLLALERRVASALPAEWRVSERLAMTFCEITRDELTSLMSSRRSEIDVKLLLHAIQRSTAFEGLLHKRFTGLDMDAGEPTGGEDGAVPEHPAAPQFVWRGAISVCFEPHLSLYIASLENTLKALIDRFIQEAKQQSAAPAVPAAPAPAGCVLSSCADLFLLYKKCLVQCAQLSTGDAMLQLSAVFRAHLASYCRLVLGAALPAAAPPPSLPAALTTLLRDDNTSRYSPAEISAIASVLTTAEYCLETATHLQHKLQERIRPDLAAQVDFTHELELFHKTIDHCIQLLVLDLEGHCEPALQAMTRRSWLHIDAVGDQSAYVTQMLASLKSQVPFLRDSLASSRKYFTQFCIRFANSLIGKFIQALYRCRPVSTVGSEQLLLDTHMLKSALLQLPSVGSQVKRAAPHTYTKVVIKLMTRAEMILKLVMAPLDSNNLPAFVQQFLQLLPDASLQEFHKVVEMKGAPRLTKAQQAAADALFKQAASERATER